MDHRKYVPITISLLVHIWSRAIKGDHGDAPINPTSVSGYTHVGCFRYEQGTFAEQVGESYEFFTVMKCITACRIRAYTIAGLREGRQCFCGGLTGHERLLIMRSNYCRMECWIDPHHWCGSTNHLSVYKSHGDNYLGCFQYDSDGVFRKHGQPGSSSASRCLADCRDLNYPLAGLENGNQCLCGGKPGEGNLQHLALADNCNTPCAGPDGATTICGGREALSVYITDEWNFKGLYLGCFRDDSRRVLIRVTLLAKTIAHCVMKCRVLGYRLAGAEHGDECYCGGNEGGSDNVYRLGRAYNCDTPCAEDPSTICGGNYALSVYRTNLKHDGYIGCFRDDSKRVLVKSSLTNLMESIHHCIARCYGYPLAGLENGNECYCGGRPDGSDNMFRLRTADNCNKPCVGDSHGICGGFWALSVYSTGSGHWNFDGNYLDCFKDDSERVLVRSTLQVLSSQTIPKCIARCKSMGYPLAGLQSKDECFCGGRSGGSDYVYRLGPADNSCNLTCSGDPEQICGGTWALSVYLTNHVPDGEPVPDDDDDADEEEDGDQDRRRFPVMVPVYPSSSNGFTYVGCIFHEGGIFTERWGSPWTSYRVMQCITGCRMRGYPMAGMVRGDECFCGNSSITRHLYPTNGCDSVCYLQYYGTTDHCGGNDKISVYKSHSDNYLGCFRNGSEGVFVLPLPMASASRCLWACKHLEYALAGLMNGNQCHCGGTKGEPEGNLLRLEQSGSCTTPCRGPDGAYMMCGGTEDLSVYMVSNWNYGSLYHGCYRDDNMRVLVKQHLRATNVSQCIQKCRVLGYRLAGAENVDECFCGGNEGGSDNVYRLGRAYNCEMPCKTGGLKCGGSWALSVYRTNVKQDNYIGCYRDDNRRVLVSSTMQILSDQTIPKCIARCKSLGYPLAGLEYGKECHCGGKPEDSDNVFRLRNADNCNKTCVGDTETICGGTWALSVYSTSGHWNFDENYLDCFKDDSERVLVRTTLQRHSHQTVPKCIARCKSMGYPLAGLQAQDECFCGGKSGGSDNVYRLGPADNSCNLTCTGDPEQICGGTWAMSVYLTNHVPGGEPMAADGTADGFADGHDDGPADGFSDEGGNDTTVARSVGVAAAGIVLVLTIALAAVVYVRKKTRQDGAEIPLVDAEVTPSGY